ncbi:MAG: hypothetical protein QW175_01730 [Candidatus Bathyarchaeia archaeon]
MPFKDKDRRRSYMKSYMKWYRQKERELLRLARSLLQQTTITPAKRRRKQK